MSDVALKESISSIPISATLMARSPMLLARSQSRISLNHMAVSKMICREKGGKGVGVCVHEHEMSVYECRDRIEYWM